MKKDKKRLHSINYTNKNTFNKRVSLSFLVVPVFFLHLVLFILDVQFGLVWVRQVPKFQKHGYSSDKQFIVNLLIFVIGLDLFEIRGQLLLL